MIEFPYKIEQCVWELTPRLGKDWSPPAWRAAGDGGEMTVGECLRVAEQLIEQGCRQVTLVGDELFGYEGWDRIARRLDDAGIRVDAVTGGMQVGPQQTAQLRRARLTRVGVAVDGLAERHDRLRGTPGAFGQAIHLLTTLLAEKFSVMVVTTLTASTVNDLPALYDMLTGLGVRQWRLRLAPGRRGATAGRIGQEHLARVARFVADKGADGRIILHADTEAGCRDTRTGASPHAPGAIPVRPGCQAGIVGLAIDSKGNVTGCPALAAERFVEGNLRTQTLAEIWRRPGAFGYNRRFQFAMLQGRCAGCDLGEICRAGCRSLCFFTTGKLYDNPHCCYQATPVPVRLVARKQVRAPQAGV